MKNIINQTNQTYTSADTSINENKLPAIYGKLEKLNVRDCTILDYGCGKYTEHIRKWCEDRNIRYLPYDPFNQDEKVNTDSYAWALITKASGNLVVGVCSNVLNVIDNDYTIDSITDELRKLTNITFYTVYEGNRSGIGKVTKKDCWQRNEKLKSYLKFFKRHQVAELKYGMITAK